MKNFTIQIKNMVCPRCIHVVKQILSDLGIKYNEVDLGYAVLGAGQSLDLDALNLRLETLELGLILDQNEVIVTEINKAVHDYLNNITLLSSKLKLSQYIAQQLARNYHQLSKIYSQHKGETIEQYFIEQRTNKVKELVKHGKLNLSQIAINVGYSSIHYLSGQFKKYTGQSLSQFKKEWEISLSSTSNVGIEPKDKTSENQDIECNCGCTDCDYEKSKPFSGVSDSSGRGDNFSSRTILKGDNESDIHALPLSKRNFGQYKVHVSV